ncbi:hypothetical protein [Dulcicalothrix desertica]|nr:hypothetical protein [Dulcicalothrix desertica]
MRFYPQLLSYAHFAQMGITGVITKPFEPTTISEQIAHILGWED